MDSGSIRSKRTPLPARRLEMKKPGADGGGNRSDMDEGPPAALQQQKSLNELLRPSGGSPPPCTPLLPALGTRAHRRVQSTREKALQDEGTNEDGGSSSQTHEMGGNVRAQQPRLWARGKKEGVGSWRGTRDGVCQEGSCLLHQRSFCL